MSKVGIFGGAFNPVHAGHTALARAAFKELKLNEMLIIPTADSRHKTNETSFEDRLEMCRLAFGGFPECSVSPYEVDNEGVSYTVLTLRHFRQMFPDDELFFIMGSDMLLSFDRVWRAPDEIARLAALAAHGATMVIFLSIGLIDRVQDALLQGAYTVATPAAVVYKATWPEQKIVHCTVGTLAESTRAAGITKTALIVVGDFLAAQYDRSKLYDPAFTTEFRRGTDR